MDCRVANTYCTYLYMGYQGEKTTASKFQKNKKTFLKTLQCTSFNEVKIQLKSLWIETPRITCLKIQCKYVTTVLKKRSKQISFTLRHMFAYLRALLKM